MAPGDLFTERALTAPAESRYAGPRSAEAADRPDLAGSGFQGSSAATPFHVAPGGPTLTRRILLLSYHFPPDQAIGALRWQRMAGYAAERRWGIDAFTLPPSDMPTTDESRLAELPGGTRVYGVSVPVSRMEAAQFAVWRTVRPLIRGSLGRRQSDEPAPEQGVAEASGAGLPGPLARAYFARLDFARMARWARRVADEAAAVVDPGIHRVVVSSGPPHMVHEAGRRLARRTRRPFVMDLRDLWHSEDVMPRDLASPTWMRLAGRYEARCVRAAALVVVNTEVARRTMVDAYPHLADRFVTVMNGADPEHIPSVPRGRRFAIRFAGNLYVGRDPRVLFRALRRVTQELSLSPDDIGIDFIGGAILGDRPVTAMADDEGIAPFFTWGAPRPRSEALEFLAGASMLVNLPQYVHASIPAKVFEYVQFDAWLLVLSEPESATAQLFAGTEADVVHPDDEAGIARVIAHRFREHRAGLRPRALNEDGLFSRQQQAQVLLDQLDRWR